MGNNSDDGFVVRRTFALKDFNQGKTRAPGREIDVIGPTGNTIGWHFDNGDRIISIDGLPVQDVNDVFAAINLSINLPTLAIEFVANSTGNVESGKITAALTTRP
jgi:hypothetical protein